MRIGNTGACPLVEPQPPLGHIHVCVRNTREGESIMGSPSFLVLLWNQTASLQFVVSERATNAPMDAMKYEVFDELNRVPC